jgi:hypothetical protein
MAIDQLPDFQGSRGRLRCGALAMSGSNALTSIAPAIKIKAVR